jgi:hypothetical protein
VGYTSTFKIAAFQKDSFILCICALRILHRYAFSRSAQARRDGRQARAGPGVVDADYEAAAAEFSDKELADLTYAIGLMNAFNRLSISFRVPPAAAKKS